MVCFFLRVHAIPTLIPAESIMNPQASVWQKFVSKLSLRTVIRRVRQINTNNNIQQLNQTASRSINASTCTSMAKFPTSSYNRTFLLMIDNGCPCYLHRLPTPIDLLLVVELQPLTSFGIELEIPISCVLAWSSNEDQPVVEAGIYHHSKGARNGAGKYWWPMDIYCKN